MKVKVLVLELLIASTGVAVGLIFRLQLVVLTGLIMASAYLASWVLERRGKFSAKYLTFILLPSIAGLSVYLSTLPPLLKYFLYVLNLSLVIPIVFEMRRNLKGKGAAEPGL